MEKIVAPPRLVTCHLCGATQTKRLGRGQHTKMRCLECVYLVTPESHAHRRARLKRCVAYQVKRKKVDPVYKEYCAGQHRAHRKRLRDQIIDGYGGKCACCGESQRQFLVLDHVKGGGNQERKTRGWTFLLYNAKRNNFPDCYRVLCHNCNMSNAYYHYCPHEVTRLRLEILNEKRSLSKRRKK